MAESSVPLAILGITALVGHTALWIRIVSTIHSTGLARPLMKALSLAAELAWLVIPLAIAWWLTPTLAARPSLAALGSGETWPVALYLAACALICCGPVLGAVLRWHRPRRVAALVDQRRQVLDFRRATGPEHAHHRLARLPGNDALRLEVVTKELWLAAWPAALDGYTIAHLTDLHLSGRVDIGYFREALRHVADASPNLVALTGDVVEEPLALGWIEPLLGGLSAPDGAWFVLGNHDHRPGAERVRQELVAAGLCDLHGRWAVVRNAAASFVIAGDPRPWFAEAADFTDAPPGAQSAGLARVLLAHTPDRLAWARRQQIDLLLAGHCHGGQFVLPGLGPFIAPSRHGIRYAGGTFDAPPTVMHVSRGLGSQWPLRIGCMPELALLRLRSGLSTGPGGQ